VGCVYTVQEGFSMRSVSPKSQQTFKLFNLKRYTIKFNCLFKKTY